MSAVVIDDREDPRLVHELARFQVPCATLRLEHGDAYWQSSAGLLVGWERKRLTDLVACIKDRRLAGSQLVGMHKTYDRVNLVIEGIWRPTASGTVEQFNGGGAWHPLHFKSEGISYQAIDGYLESLSEIGGVRVWRTQSFQETAALYASRFHWWQRPYDSHRSVDAIYSPDPEFQRQGKVKMFREATPVVQAAALLPHVDAKSWSLAVQYASPRDLYNADVADWQRTTWTDSSGKEKRFGRKVAEEIVGWLRGRNGR